MKAKKEEKKWQTNLTVVERSIRSKSMISKWDEVNLIDRGCVLKTCFIVRYYIILYEVEAMLFFVCSCFSNFHKNHPVK